VRRADLGDLSQFGLPIPADGAFARAHRLGQAPTLVDLEVIDAVKDGSIDMVTAVESFGGDKVTLTDGSTLDPDAVIAATGYGRDLTALMGHLGVLGADDRPLAMGETAAADGLRFFGYLSRPSMIGHFGKQSRRVAKRIAQELAV
jgi:hypothetical protein